jgi:hypothetical protein
MEEVMLVGTYVLGADAGATRSLIKTQNDVPPTPPTSNNSTVPVDTASCPTCPPRVACAPGLPWWWLLIAGTGGVVVGSLGALALQKKGRRR